MPHLAERTLEAAGIGGWELDVATGGLRWTTVTFRILELDPDEQPSLERAIDFYAPSARPAIRAAVAAAIADGTPWDLELPVVTARGRHIWVSTRGRAIHAAGKTTHLYGVFEDITARRELAQREVLLSVVAAQMTNVVMAMDLDGRIDWVNDAFTRVTGYTLAEARGRMRDDLLAGPETDRKAVEDRERCKREGRSYQQEILNYHKDGRTSWMAASGSPLRDAAGDLTGYISVESDITERRAAEDAARREAAERKRTEALLRDVLDTLPNAVTAYDANETFVMGNRAYAELFPIAASVAAPGRKLEDVLREAVEAGQFADAPTDRAGRDAWIAQHLALVRGSVARTVRLPDGRIMQVNERRSATGTLVTVRTDTTALHHAEEKARREASERERAEALLRDVIDTLPVAVIAYDEHERVILSNRAHAEMAPISGRFTVPGATLEDIMRLAAEHGQFSGVPEAPQARAAWLAAVMAKIREWSGQPRMLRMADGRVNQIRERRSAHGNLVVVRTDITELDEAQENVRREAAERARTEALLRDVLDTVPSAIIAFDSDDRVILTNRAFLDLYPVTARFATPGRRMDDMVRLAAENGLYADKPAAPQTVEQWIEQALHTLRSGVVHTVPLADGRFVQMRGRRSPNGTLVSVRTETTELVRAQALLRDVLEALPSAVTAYDQEERLILTNPTYFDMFPIAARFAKIGERLEDTLRLAAEHGQFPDAGSAPQEQSAWLAKRMAAHRSPGPPCIVQLPGGRFVQARESRSKSGITVAIRTDATDLVRAETTMRVLAQSDALTGLANRSAFLAALDSALALAHAPTEPRAGGALLLFDVDYFKQINDTLGHDIGDALLIEIGRRLRHQLRGSDVPARLGGDEFGAIMPGLWDPSSLASRMDVIHAALSAPFELAGRLLPIGLSVGVTTFPADGTEPSRLLKNADLALYEAKRHGRGRWAAFRPEQAAALDRHNRLADALREALARGQTTVALQPKRRLRDGRHDGFEALARWHDGANWVPPTEFIPVAEQSGLIGLLGRAIMDAALERIQQLRELGLDPGRVAVNVTAPQLLDARFKGDTLAALRRHGLRPADLELEVTETVLLGRAAERIDTVLREFNELGITLALDDFGTGYASLAHLSRLPIDRLKIDRSFVIGIGTGGAGAVIARTVVNLARSLEMESIAEGIETLDQLAFLEAAGCDAGQGYLFSEPLLTMAEAATYLRSRHKEKNWERYPAARLV